MSTIPTSVTEEQFELHVRPFLTTAKRGYPCKIALVKVFNYLLYRLHTGCQWAQLPIAPARADPEKKRLAGKRSTITSRNGAPMAVFSGSGNKVSKRSKLTSI